MSHPDGTRKALGLMGAVLCLAAVAQSTDTAFDGHGLMRPKSLVLMPNVDLEQASAARDDVVATATTGEHLRALAATGERRATRGAAGANLYQRAAPGVVLILTKEGSGSGSLLDPAGTILTNWHVVRGQSEAGVIFQPHGDGARPVDADMVRAKVLRVDEVADLALLRVEKVHPRAMPLPLGTLEGVQVGVDVHAIGHPSGLHWSYTRGVVSQLRPGFQWNDGEKSHVANVVQTQTPISPGNSGGPLLDDAGRLVGVNSFVRANAQNLNFAVTVDEVRRFLAANGSRSAAPSQQATRDTAVGTPACREQKLVYQGRRDGQVDVAGYDTRCTGRADLEIRKPLDPSQPVTAAMDRNGDGRVDLLVFSPARDGRWTLSWYDNDFDGQWDVVGHHDDGSMVARRFESYAVWAAARGK